MPRILPPLETFRFFEAVARHLNFTHAAGEMHVTHGAVSQRIKRLEEDLGTPLFRRSGRGMLLTDEGRRLLERVRAAIGEITEGVEAIRSSNRDRILTVSMVPGFATYWLLPRLAEFIERHPDIEVNIRPTLSLTDFTRDEVDMAVRFGPGACIVRGSRLGIRPAGSGFFPERAHEILVLHRVSAPLRAPRKSSSVPG